VVRESAHILLEGTPKDFDAAAITADLSAAIPEIGAVRHVHAWSICEERPMVTLEAVMAPGADLDAARRTIKARLAEKFGFGHATVELHGPDSDTETRAELPKDCSASI
jgi:cobalt-zinc-cadmium efflux system protein